MSRAAVVLGLIGVLGSFAMTAVSGVSQTSDWGWDDDAYRRMDLAFASSWVALLGVVCLAIGEKFRRLRWLGVALILPVPFVLASWIGGLNVFAGAPLLLAAGLALLSSLRRRRARSAQQTCC